MISFSVLASGSTGNAIYVGSENVHLLIDAGISGKGLIHSLHTIGVAPEQLSTILITHEHQDHIRGLGAIARKYQLPIYATEGTWEGLPGSVGAIAEPLRHVFAPADVLEYGDLRVETFRVSHDAREPVAFCIRQGERKLTIVTDLGYVNERIKEALQGADVIVLETNHDTEMLRAGKYPWHLKRRILGDKGHLSNVDAGYALREVLSQRQMDVYLAHQSQENNMPMLAELTVRTSVADAGSWVDDYVRLHQTFANRPTPLHTIA